MSIVSPAPESKPSVLRRSLPWLGLVVAAVAVYDGSIFYSRWSRTREAARQSTEIEARQAKAFLKTMGGTSELKILGFYASPGAVRPGQRSSLCYGVSGAKTVRLEPPVEEVWPAVSRCIMVSPEKDTEYKFTAEDATGRTVSQGVTIQLQR